MTLYAQSGVKPFACKFTFAFHVIEIMVFLLLQTKFSCVPSPSAVAGAKFAFVSTSSWAGFVEWSKWAVQPLHLFRKILQKKINK